MDQIEDAYYGEYDSFSEFARQLAEETIEGLNDNSTLSKYFDWDAWEKDLEYDFHEGEGENGTSIIFNSNW